MQEHARANERAYLAPIRESPVTRNSMQRPARIRDADRRNHHRHHPRRLLLLTNEERRNDDDRSHFSPC